MAYRQGQDRYKPGKTPGYMDNPTRRKPEHRAAWVQTEPSHVTILLGNQHELPDEERFDYGRDVVLEFPRPGRIPNMYVNLTNMTEEELLAYKKLLETAIEWALPVVQRRDQEAQDAVEQGDDSVGRIYRPLPQLVFRQRKVGEHYESVPIRSQGISPSGGRVFHTDGGVRGAGDELAEHDSDESSSEDDATKVDES